jgi:putative membrane protein
MQAKAFNPQIFLEFLCYSVFGGLMLYLVSSGKYLSYVTPRMEPYLYFTAIVMGIWALVGLGRLFRPQHRVRSAHCFVLVIPILLLLLPHSPLSTSDLSGNYIGGNTFSSRSGQPQKQAPAGESGSNDPSSIPTENPAESSTDPADDPAAVTPPENEYLTNLPGLDVANQKITVSNDDFGVWLTEIYTNTKKYGGYTVVMTGFVFKDPETLKKDEFVPARLMMSCCVADLTPAGLLCKYDKASELKADSWVTVEGTLFIGQYEYDGIKYDEPQITVTKITPAEAVEGYVYPY